MITLDQLKDNYVMPLLNSTPFKFMIFTDAGNYRHPDRRKNTVTEYINGLFSLSQSEVQRLGGGLTAVALVTNIKLLIPCGDNSDTSYTGELRIVQQIRDALSEVLSQNVKLSITSDGKTYVGGVSYTLPSAELRNLRQGIGDSLEYSFSITFAYLENALNATDVKILIDGAEIAYTSFLLTRRINPSADLYKNSTNGEAKAYAENSTFTIDLEMPALSDSPPSLTILNRILGITSVNTSHTVVLTIGDITTQTFNMMFGECSASGAGVSNIVYKVSLLPFAAQEVIGG